MNVKQFVSQVLRQVNEGMADGGQPSTIEVTFELDVSSGAKVDGVDDVHVDGAKVKFWALTGRLK